MAPRDTEQRADVAEMIRTGTNESFAASLAQLALDKVAMQHGHDDMRVTTETEIKNQRVHNAEVDKKYVESKQSIEAQFTVLRAEFGTEFDSTIKDAAEIRTLLLVGRRFRLRLRPKIQ